MEPKTAEQHNAQFIGKAMVFPDISKTERLIIRNDHVIIGELILTGGRVIAKGDTSKIKHILNLWNHSRK